MKISSHFPYFYFRSVRDQSVPFKSIHKQTEITAGPK